MRRCKTAGIILPAVLHGFLRVFYLKYSTVGRKLRRWKIVLEQNNNFREN